jgi:hypothetical protein
MMSPVATQLVGTVTVGTSAAVTINPVLSNSPFSNLAIHVKPFESLDCKYDVAVYIAGELEETHSYPDEDDRVLAKMMFPNLLFPANAGTNAIPKFYNPSREDFTGDLIQVQITNNEAITRVFEVYALFLAWDHCRFGVITQN